ncbi:putative DOPA-dioxygenase [Sugiyamaella lignohabitans]|uniref:Putative DOPA-dioxygenase n=1 Tax=Sugiyamaella lignohabitans TaxID=796027 RepID=A0A161HHH0_9ASCO|nr:putative DOPA-dioxygenase [Sugiyamaella lignohabitans]ANB11597.1 putative DOPA-dioxygenase [Sugiyamaella lignohabitans]
MLTLGRFQLNHGSLSVLVHPHTGFDVADHTDHAIWIGEKVPLIVGVLEAAEKRQSAAAATTAPIAPIAVASAATTAPIAVAAITAPISVAAMLLLSLPLLLLLLCYLMQYDI